MINENSKHEEEFLKSVKDQLYSETFMKDFPKYSSDRVETLVKMIELDERSDEEEAEECHANFDKQFLKITASSKKDRRKANFMKTARTVAAMLVIVLLADVTSHAVMDKSLFHMISWWKNQMSIVPSENIEPGTINYQECDVAIFSNVEEFAEYFDDDFLVCSCFPENIKLKEISLTKIADTCNYIWNYGKESEDNTINIRMYEKSANDIAGLTGTQIENGERIRFDNGITATICEVNSEECLAAFEYNGWWYIVYAGSNEEIVKSVLGGMTKYE